MGKFLVGLGGGVFLQRAAIAHDWWAVGVLKGKKKTGKCKKGLDIFPICGIMKVRQGRIGKQSAPSSVG